MPVRTVSTWMPRAAASAASVCPEPVVSLPSERSTIRFCASSGNSAPASRRAAPMSVASRTGVDAIRSISARSDGRRSTSASAPNATIPATSSSCFVASDSRRYASAASRPALPTESERSTTNTTASRSTGSTSWSPASAPTRQASSRPRTTRAARRRPLPRRRRDERWRAMTTASSGGRSSSAAGTSNEMPIRRCAPTAANGRVARRPRAGSWPACRARRRATRA